MDGPPFFQALEKQVQTNIVQLTFLFKTSIDSVQHENAIYRVY